MKTIISIGILLSVLVYKPCSAAELKVFFVVNDNDILSNDLKTMMDFIYLKNKYIKVSEFNLWHYSKELNIGETWRYKKKQVKYLPSKTTCNFTFDNDILPLIRYEATKTKSKFYSSEKNPNLKLSNIEIVPLPNRNESTIIEVLKNEIKKVKSQKTDLTLFFYLTSAQNSLPQSQISFLEDTITCDQGGSVTISPKYTGNLQSVSWSPRDYLSCADCKTPVATPASNITYTLTGVDSLGCPIKPVMVALKVKNNCNYGKNLSLKFDLKSNKTGPDCDLFFYKDKSEKLPYEWEVHSTQSGSYLYEFVATPNCAKEYHVSILNNKGEVIWSDTYKKSDVDGVSSKNNLHKCFPEKLVFRMALSSIKDYIEDTEQRDFRIQIESLDEKNKTYDTYISPKIFFFKC